MINKLKQSKRMIFLYQNSFKRSNQKIKLLNLNKKFRKIKTKHNKFKKQNKKSIKLKYNNLKQKNN